jgi:hypothetical protein
MSKQQVIKTAPYRMTCKACGKSSYPSQALFLYSINTGSYTCYDCIESV